MSPQALRRTGFERSSSSSIDAQCADPMTLGAVDVDEALSPACSTMIGMHRTDRR
jgi:hypothetical protein